MKIKSKKPKISLSSTEDYMNQTPSRGEVAGYVQSIMDGYYMPLISSQIQLSSVILQGILLEKGLCTSEEMKEIAANFIREHKLREISIKDQSKVTSFLVKESQLDVPEESIKSETSLYTRLQAVEKLLVSETDYKIPDDCKADLYDLIKSSLLMMDNVQSDNPKITDDDLKQVSLRALELRNKLLKAGYKIEFDENSKDNVLLVQSAILHVLVELIAKSSVGIQK